MSDVPYKKAREAFNRYAAMDAPQLPENQSSALQVMMYRWAMSKVPKHTLPLSTEGVLGTVEEVGECAGAMFKLFEAAGKLAHLELNASQGRRGYDKDVEKLRALVADAIGDAHTFMLQLGTAMRLDVWTICFETAKEVAERDWKTRPLNAHEELPTLLKPACRACESETYIKEKLGLETQSAGHTCGEGCSHPTHKLTGWQQGVEKLDRELNPDLYRKG